MSATAIDAAAFAELQESAGADFVQELVDTPLSSVAAGPVTAREFRSNGAARTESPCTKMRCPVGA